MQCLDIFVIVICDEIISKKTHFFFFCQPEEEEVFVFVVGVVEMVGNESWVLDLDFHVFETEVQMMMDLISKRTKIWVRITTGKDFHLSSLFWKRESKTTKDCGLEHGV